MSRASTCRARLLPPIAAAFAVLLPLAAHAGQDARRADAAAAPRAGGYVFTYFTKNGEDGLHLAWSADGYRWEKVAGGRSLLAPRVGTAKLMRDPCIVRGPDGIYHMVWTSGWNENNIGHASSRDLITWSAQQTIPVMAHEPTVLNSWAPEVVYDATRQEYLIFWASTIPGRFAQTAGSSEEKYNHRIYATTTKDWVTFTPTRLFYDPGFSVIDATLLETPQGPRLIVKDETRYPPKKYLQLAGAADRQGPFPALAPPFTPAGVWVEGPTALRVGDDYVVYFDAYMAKHYGAMRSRDLVTWEDVTSRMHFPDEGTAERMRHGTVIAVPADLLAALRGLK